MTAATGPDPAAAGAAAAAGPVPGTASPGPDHAAPRIRPDGHSRAPLTEDGAAVLLGSARKLQLATINADGTPHLVTMYFGLLDGWIAFWTYRASQKARNLARDPRLTVLIEAGQEYFDLRGVQITGIARPVEDPEQVTRIGRLVASGLPGVPAEAADEYVRHAARKRIGYLVEPTRILGWDHRTLLA